LSRTLWCVRFSFSYYHLFNCCPRLKLFGGFVFFFWLLRISRLLNWGFSPTWRLLVENSSMESNFGFILLWLLYNLIDYGSFCLKDTSSRAHSCLLDFVSPNWGLISQSVGLLRWSDFILGNWGFIPQCGRMNIRSTSLVIHRHEVFLLLVFFIIIFWLMFVIVLVIIIWAFVVKLKVLAWRCCIQLFGCDFRIILGIVLVRIFGIRYVIWGDWRS